MIALVPTPAWVTLTGLIVFTERKTDSYAGIKP